MATDESHTGQPDTRVMQGSKPWARWAVRLVCLAAAVALSLGGPLPNALRRVVPGLGPLVLVIGSITSRSWYVGLFWGLPALAALAMACWRGRFFCRWICPTGTLHSSVALASAKRRLLARRLNGVLFWAILGGAVAGLPFLLSLEPLSSFTRMTPFLRGWFSAAALVPGLVVPAFLLLGLVQPVIWCTHFCPMGYLFDLVHVKARQPLIRQDSTRRDIILGLVLALPAGRLARRLYLRPPRKHVDLPILPPGARTSDQFAALCSRCYACVNACPTDVLRVSAPLDRPLGQWFHPELDTNRSYCEERCNQCTQVCPTGAIMPLTMDEKRRRTVGTAHVVRDICLAWADRQYCTVCTDCCPYNAVVADEADDGIPEPKVNARVCRGCGICQVRCPADRDGKAIVVRGIEVQRMAGDAEPQRPSRSTSRKKA